MQSIKSLKNLKGKKVLVRVDYNVPIAGGKVTDDFRIKKSLKTIDFLLKKGANLLLVTHLGKDGSESIEPVKKRFFALSKAPKDRVIFFENVRKFAGEKANDLSFAKTLAGQADIYVNEAFSVSHRKDASIVSVPKLLPSYAGFQLEEESHNLSKAFKNSRHPFLFILGGAKFSTKMPLLKKYLKLADTVFVGGALANDFFKASGYEVGKSLLDENDYGIKNILKNKKLVLPQDVWVESLGKRYAKKLGDISKNDYIVDIGPESSKMLSLIIKKSKFVLWNGPLGRYEASGMGETKNTLKTLASMKVESVVGGGDTVAIISKMKIEEKLGFVSTGGGATLDFLAKGTLPGIKALEK
ncbi:MAG: phosphoglycerate kinase [Candidatus Pacebacteria bacterium]|nr:phosphoglycerate kinase [Candidatus Paceibacterota bacterium]MCF7862657.1 phosphoglycerate kinase [Candidatus Paceibacterota bacterium]